MACWMKTPLGTEVDLGPGHIVLDGNPAHPRERGRAPLPLFGPCLLWPRSPISATAELLFSIRLLLSTSTIAICRYCPAQSRYKFSSPMEGSRRSRPGTAVRVYIAQTLSEQGRQQACKTQIQPYGLSRRQAAMPNARGSEVK